MLENIILPLITGAVFLLCLMGVIGFLLEICDNLVEFIIFLITLPMLWLVGKVVLLVLDKLF